MSRHFGRSSTAEASRTAETIRASVRGVLDPALGEPLGDYNLVGDVDLQPGGRVVIHVSTLTSDEGHQARLGEAVVATVRSVEGVGDVVVEMASLDEAARAAIAHRLRTANRPPGSMGSTTRVYAIGSGKGGVGKSSVTANLAVALARSGHRVGVLDADVWGYSMPQIFGTRRSAVAVKGMMLPVSAHGVGLMSMGFFVEEEQPVVWRGPMLQKALEQFLADVYWGAVDVLLVDLPPGTGDVPLTIAQLLPDAALIVVTTPQKAAVQVAARAGRMALDARMPVAGVVENMSGAAFGSGGGETLAAKLGTTLLGQIPLDEQLRQCGDDGIPLVVSDPDSPAARVIREVAANLPVFRPSLVGKSLPLFVNQPTPASI